MGSYMSFYVVPKARLKDQSDCQSFEDEKRIEEWPYKPVYLFGFYGDHAVYRALQYTVKYAYENYNESHEVIYSEVKPELLTETISEMEEQIRDTERKLRDETELVKLTTNNADVIDMWKTYKECLEDERKDLAEVKAIFLILDMINRSCDVDKLLAHRE